MDLMQRVIDATNEGRDNAAERAANLDLPASDDAIVLLTGWITGVEDALAQIVAEVEKLSARIGAQPS